MRMALPRPYPAVLQLTLLAVPSTHPQLIAQAVQNRRVTHLHSHADGSAQALPMLQLIWLAVPSTCTRTLHAQAFQSRRAPHLDSHADGIGLPLTNVAADMACCCLAICLTRCSSIPKQRAAHLDSHEDGLAPALPIGLLFPHGVQIVCQRIGKQKGSTPRQP